MLWRNRPPAGLGCCSFRDYSRYCRVCARAYLCNLDYFQIIFSSLFGFIRRVCVHFLMCTTNNWIQDATASSHFRDRWQTRIEQTKREQKHEERRLRSTRTNSKEKNALEFCYCWFWFISFFTFFTLQHRVCNVHSSFSFVWLGSCILYAYYFQI